MRTIRTSQIRAAFLDTLGKTGNVTLTCDIHALHRPAIYAWRNEDAGFAADWEAALVLGTEALEDEAQRRAMKSSDLLMIFLLKGLKPDKYRERSTVDVTHRAGDLRNVPIDELRRRLDQLRREQDRPNPAEPPELLLIEGSLSDAKPEQNG
jgi:hypothetical protein